MIDTLVSLGEIFLQAAMAIGWLALTGLLLVLAIMCVGGVISLSISLISDLLRG